MCCRRVSHGSQWVGKDMDTSDLWKGFFTSYYDGQSELFPYSRVRGVDESDIDWKEDFSTALGYHIMHYDYDFPVLDDVLFGTSSHAPSTRVLVPIDFNQVMEIFSYMRFRCKELVLKFDKLNESVMGDLVHRHIETKLQGEDSGITKCPITKLCSCIEIYLGDYCKGYSFLEMLCDDDVEYVIHFEGRQVNNIIPLAKQPLLKSIFISSDRLTCMALREVLYHYFITATRQEQTFSLDVDHISLSGDLRKLTCCVDSCKSFLCRTNSSAFYRWVFSNSLVLKCLKLCATGTEVLNDLHNLDIQVEHLELDCSHSSRLGTVLSIRDLQALTIVEVSLSDLCSFLMSALQSKLNLRHLSLRIADTDTSSIDEQWKLTELAHLVFSFPTLETFEFVNLLEEMFLNTFLVAWRNCFGGRKLTKLTVCYAYDCNIDKLNAMAMLVDARDVSDEFI